MQRIVYFDFLRGIAIIMVVCLHCIDYSAMEGPVLNLFGVEFRNLLNAAVPLFLAISGYFMANKKTDTPTAYKEFLKRQAVKVYIPMLVWSVPYLILAYLHRENSVTSWLLFFFGGFSIYYFIILIVQYYALLPLMQKMGRSLRGGGAGSRRNQHRLHILFGNPALCISDGNTIDRICRAVPAVDHVLRDRNRSTEPYGSNEIRLPAGASFLPAVRRRKLRHHALHRTGNGARHQGLFVPFFALFHYHAIRKSPATLSNCP